MRGNKKQIARDYLIKLAEKHNGLTAAILVNEARNPSCPIHNDFNWKDSNAAKKWRLHQARMLIKSITLMVEYREQEIVTRIFKVTRESKGSPKMYRHFGNQ